MAEPNDVINTLARFTPAAGLNRDELLFRAGRASAPSARWWKRATAALAVAQAVTLALWLRPPEPQPVAAPPAVVPAPPDVEPMPPLPPSSYLVLSHAWESDNALPVPAAPASSERPAKPLTAGWRGRLLD
jgi:hypothetical protein